MAQESNVGCGVRRPTEAELTRRRLFIESEAFQEKASDPRLVTIRVAVHVVSRSLVSEEADDAEVQSQIDALNRDYQGQSDGAVANAKIAFQLDRIVRVSFPADTPAFTEARVRDASPYEPNCLNIWVCEFDSSRGVATFPWERRLADGVVVRRSAFGTTGPTGYFRGGRTATHEIGHWLGLLHVEEDKLGDTLVTMPADFMSSSSTDAEMKLFTEQQVSVMRGYLRSSRGPTVRP